jgi:hypothetical protein
VLHHVTYSINSLCHFFGPRRYATDDHSRNPRVAGAAVLRRVMAQQPRRLPHISSARTTPPRARSLRDRDPRPRAPRPRMGRYTRQPPTPADEAQPAARVMPRPIG